MIFLVTNFEIPILEHNRQHEMEHSYTMDM
jgi:hypothetical protein